MTIAASDRGRLESALVARLPSLLEDVAEGLREYWPDYADFLSAESGGVAEAGTLFVRQLMEMAEPSPTDADAAHRSSTVRVGEETVHLVFEQIGRQQLRAGNDLTRLLTAFQLGARQAWRQVSTTALQMDLAPEVLASLADSVFVFVNELSFSAARGYLQAQLDDARLRERNREELVRLLLSERASQEAVRAAARRADWPLPDRAAVVLVDPGDDTARRLVDGLGGNCLAVRQADVYGAIVPNVHTTSGRTNLARQLRGAGAVVGYVVPLDRLPRSAEVARVVEDLRRQGMVTGDPVFAEEHLDTIIVWRDPALTEALRRGVLAPFADLPETVRERLVDTLTSWLRHQGDRHAMAAELSIHPQTVRYRMAQVRELLGDALDSPRERARLFLALSWPVRPPD
ncbi:putative Transcriptional regulator, CdaR family [Nostocoides japonicum T1-X7]|uniref:Putative Transcriptional regulator, CdaR family n=1 Tax=Nostocoides japonicum T1-X7 TaxID=1194083 RepID=A0A077M3K1_9MICO|nr:PucR family transcriptional regulator [Tetrasphaera japonica]CCH78710.1 putative Transcriptional regulator, CdaR family [Tetrasphaera japonica T1-X7]